ncbi:hypothetical protein V8G54_032259, partial [Vigna mungo]
HLRPPTDHHHCFESSHAPRHLPGLNRRRLYRLPNVGVRAPPLPSDNHHLWSSSANSKAYRWLPKSPRTETERNPAPLLIVPESMMTSPSNTTSSPSSPSITDHEQTTTIHFPVRVRI